MKFKEILLNEKEKMVIEIRTWDITFFSKILQSRYIGEHMIKTVNNK